MSRPCTGDDRPGEGRKGWRVLPKEDCKRKKEQEGREARRPVDRRKIGRRGKGEGEGGGGREEGGGGGGSEERKTLRSI